jgi:hypothetical protein
VPRRLAYWLPRWVRWSSSLSGSASRPGTLERRESAGHALGKLTPARYVCLSVRDNGHGFDERAARRLFEPFFTTRSAGTGLGLATVREIVRDHDGAMNVRSNPGRGSCFEAGLPAAVTDSTSVDGPEMLPLGRGETVLVVDSEQERLLRDEEMLAALGYEPVGIEHSADAIAACRVSPGRFDAAVVSQGASEPDGLHLARALHEFMPRRPHAVRHYVHDRCQPRCAGGSRNC